MIVKPKLYELVNNNYTQLGGYLLNGVEFLDEIILSNWELKSEIKFTSNNQIINLVNYINSVAFKINKNVLDFILKNNNKYYFFIEPNKIHDLALKTRLTKDEKKELESFYSKKYLEANILGLADLFKNIWC